MEELFDEIKIREEIKRLDKLTGLNGADLPIKFGNAKSVLGRFYNTKKAPVKFYFSNYYFSDPYFPVEEKLDTIRHEYAHYIDYMLNGYTSHGPNWKKICRVVGAFPSSKFDQERANSFLEKHEKDRLKNLELDSYIIGGSINHPHFGCGTIKNIEGQGLSRMAIVEFQNGVYKKLSLKWINENIK